MCSEKLLFWVGFTAGTFLTSVGFAVFVLMGVLHLEKKATKKWNTRRTPHDDHR